MSFTIFATSALEASMAVIAAFMSVIVRAPASAASRASAARSLAWAALSAVLRIIADISSSDALVSATAAPCSLLPVARSLLTVASAAAAVAVCVALLSSESESARSEWIVDRTMPVANRAATISASAAAEQMAKKLIRTLALVDSACSAATSTLYSMVLLNRSVQSRSTTSIRSRRRPVASANFPAPIRAKTSSAAANSSPREETAASNSDRSCASTTSAGYWPQRLSPSRLIDAYAAAAASIAFGLPAASMTSCRMVRRAATLLCTIRLSVTIDGTVLVAITRTLEFIATSSRRLSPATSSVISKRAMNPPMMRPGMVQVFMGSRVAG